MPRQKLRRVHQRDIDILYTLYRARALSSKHIGEMFYSHINRARERLKQLREMGWINYYPYYNKTMYHITDKGLSILREHIDVDEKEKAYNVMISSKRMRAYQHFSNIIASTYKHGWDFEDSRIIKESLSLPTAAYIQGALITPTLEKYPVFVVNSQSTVPTINGVLREINSITSARGALLIVSGEDTFMRIIDHPAIPRFMIPVHILPSAYARRVLPCILPFSEHSYKYNLVSTQEENCPYRYQGNCVTELITFTHSNLIRVRYGTPSGEVWAAEETMSLIRNVTGKYPDKVVNIPCASSP